MTTNTPQFDTLREAYAAIYDCRPEDFEHRVFWRCLHLHAGLPARWMWAVERDFFRTDLEVVQALAEARCDADLRRAIDDLENHTLVERSLRRGMLRIRLSPSRLRRLLNPLLPLLKPLPEQRESEPLIAPAPARAEGARRPLRRVDELKSLRRIHSRIVAGIAVPDALQEAGLGKDEFLASLVDHAPSHPELAWLLSYLHMLDEVEALRRGRPSA